MCETSQFHAASTLRSELERLDGRTLLGALTHLAFARFHLPPHRLPRMSPFCVLFFTL